MWYGLKVSSLCARKRSRHPMATKNDTKTFLYIYDMLQKTFVESLFQFPWAYLAVHLRIVSRPKKIFKYFYDKKKIHLIIFSKVVLKVQENTLSLFGF